MIRTTKNIVVATLTISILGLALIRGAVYWRLGSANGGGDVGAGSADRSLTPQELARYDGENDSDA